MIIHIWLNTFCWTKANNRLTTSVSPTDSFCASVLAVTSNSRHKKAWLWFSFHPECRPPDHPPKNVCFLLPPEPHTNTGAPGKIINNESIRGELQQLSNYAGCQDLFALFGRKCGKLMNNRKKRQEATRLSVEREIPNENGGKLLQIYVFCGSAIHLHFVGGNSTINNSFALVKVSSNKSFSFSQLFRTIFSTSTLKESPH